MNNGMEMIQKSEIVNTFKAKILICHNAYFSSFKKKILTQDCEDVLLHSSS